MIFFKRNKFNCLSSCIFSILIWSFLANPIQAQSLAVTDFDGYGISQTEAIALTNRLRNELFRIGIFEVVERSMMEEILNEQGFQMTGCTSTECLVEVGRLLGAQNMVGGSISKVGTIFSVSARLVDTESGRLLAVSDYDLKGEIGDMLTVGMKQVALLLADKEIPQEATQQPVATRIKEENNQTKLPVDSPSKGVKVEDWSLGGAGKDSDERLMRHIGGMLIFGPVGGSTEYKLHTGISLGYTLRRRYNSSLEKFFEDKRIYLLADGHLRTGGKLPLDVYAGLGPGYGGYREGWFYDEDDDRYLIPFTEDDSYYPDPKEWALVFHAGVGTKIFNFLSVGVEFFVTSSYGGTIFYKIGL